MIEEINEASELLDKTTNGDEAVRFVFKSFFFFLFQEKLLETNSFSTIDHPDRQCHEKPTPATVSHRPERQRHPLQDQHVPAGCDFVC